MYDVTFSFAGEQRKYVEETYHSLTSLGVKAFYDRDQTVNLWGKDLYQHLSDVYRTQARYCVVFLSRDYAAKLWTRHELKSMQARAFQEAREYILPARFDNTEIPGLLPTIGYIDLNQYSPQEFAKLIAQKVLDKTINDASVPLAIDRDLEKFLADAVIWAEEYLKPQPLGLADNIAEVIRHSFREAHISPTAQHIIPYMRNSNAAYRIVGYLIYQIYPVPGMTLELVGCLSSERIEAIERIETRPLWQLLLCFGDLLSKTMDSATRQLVHSSLNEFLSFLENNPHIDSGGECKSRIQLLMGR